MDVDARVDWAYFRRSIVNGGGYWEPPQITIYVGVVWLRSPLRTSSRLGKTTNKNLKRGRDVQSW
jgi:hypothetical protein